MDCALEGKRSIRRWQISTVRSFPNNAEHRATRFKKGESSEIKIMNDFVPVLHLQALLNNSYALAETLWDCRVYPGTLLRTYEKGNSG